MDKPIETKQKTQRTVYEYVILFFAAMLLVSHLGPQRHYKILPEKLPGSTFVFREPIFMYWLHKAVHGDRCQLVEEEAE